MQVVKKVISPETAPRVSLPVAKVASVVLNEVAGVPVVATTTEVDESASSVVVKAILPGKPLQFFCATTSNFCDRDCTSAGGPGPQQGGGYGGSWSRGGGQSGGQTCYVSFSGRNFETQLTK